MSSRLRETLQSAFFVTINEVKVHAELISLTRGGVKAAHWTSFTRTRVNPLIHTTAIHRNEANDLHKCTYTTDQTVKTC